MRRPLVLALLLSSAGFLAAQSTTSTLYVQPPESHACPVKLSAERAQNSGLIAVDHNHASQDLGVDVRLFASPANIVSASVTVHGISSVAMIPLSSSSRDNSTESFEFNATNDKPLFHLAVWTKSMTGISWLEITKIVYANGTTWESKDGAHCIAVPNLFVLVNSTGR